MKIVNARTLPEVCIPLSEPTVMAFHNPSAATSTPMRWAVSILSIETDEGVFGISEGADKGILHNLKPKLVGRDPFDIELLMQELTSVYFGDTSYARYGAGYYWTCAAIEIACWDIMGKVAKVPIHKLMGGKVWEKIPITRFIGINSPEKAAKEAMDAVAHGITTIKLKVGHDLKQDLELVRSVREAVGDETVLRVDANQAWSSPTAINQINRMAEYDIQFVEQPLTRWDWEGLLRLRDKTSTPICICEGWGYEHQVDKLPRLLQLIKEQAFDFLSTDPYRTGGLLGFKKTCAICEAAGIPVISHWNNTGLGISTATWLHACASNRAVMHGQDILCSNMKPGPVDDVVLNPFRQKDGYLDVPSNPGLGVVLDEAKMEKWTVVPDTHLSPPKEETAHPIENLRVQNGYSPPRF